MSSKQVSKKQAAPKKETVPKTPRKKKEVVQEVATPPSVVEEEVATPVEPKTKKTPSQKKVRVRRDVNRETLEADFNELQKKVEDEIEKLREVGSEKVKGVKFLRSINKALKTLRTDSLRVLKIKPKNTRPRSTNSGFMKPVGISPEMATFTGWDAAALYSRVEVTKFICKYIRDNSLQNQEDRRQIVCDEKLKTLLKYDAATATSPLTYFRLQQYIQPHFVKTA